MVRIFLCPCMLRSTPCSFISFCFFSLPCLCFSLYVSAFLSFFLAIFLVLLHCLSTSLFLIFSLFCLSIHLSRSSSLYVSLPPSSLFFVSLRAGSLFVSPSHALACSLSIFIIHSLYVSRYGFFRYLSQSLDLFLMHSLPLSFCIPVFHLSHLLSFYALLIVFLLASFSLSLSLFLSLSLSRSCSIFLSSSVRIYRQAHKNGLRENRS